MRKIKKKRASKPVIVCDRYDRLIKEYKSVAKAASDLDVGVAAIYMAIHKKGLTNGVRWLYKKKEAKEESIPCYSIQRRAKETPCISLQRRE